MTITRQIVRLASLASVLALLAQTHSAAAGEVVLFDGSAPKAAELAKILWPSKHLAAGAEGSVGQTRSIRISAEPKAAAAPAQIVATTAEQAAPAPAPARVQVAKAEPVATSDAADEAPAARAPAGDAFAFPIQFAYNSTEVLPQSRQYLDSVGEMLRLPEAKGKRIAVVGHTDATGSADYNQGLSERRAVAVRTYLEIKFGIAASRLEAEGEGEAAPLAGSDPYAAQNRRVEFHAAG